MSFFQMSDSTPQSLRRWRFGMALAAAIVVLGGGFFAPSAAMAETFTVELTDGTSFLTLYKPQEASWDSETILILTDQGNSIGIPKSSVASVVSETESKGFGRVIDTTTVILGWAANDAPTETDSQEFSTVERLQQLFNSQQQDYSVPQFVSPSEAGRTGGLPAYGASPQSSGFTYFGGSLTPRAPAPTGGVVQSSPAVGGPAPVVSTGEVGGP
ncbi:MAG: hypothetical protein AAF481_09630 [Acidobacteriota bacterium]